MLGIFSSKLGTQEVTQKALELEARGDYSAAKKLYDEVSECLDVQLCQNLTFFTQ